MHKEPKELLKHILDESRYNISVSENCYFEDSFADETLKRAIIKSLEIIGEATKNVPAEFKAKWNSIEWKIWLE